MENLNGMVSGIWLIIKVPVSKEGRQSDVDQIKTVFKENLKNNLLSNITYNMLYVQFLPRLALQSFCLGQTHVHIGHN